jgi:serine protease Do
MNFLNTIRTRKLLSSTLILFTLSIGIMIGTLINTGVKAAKDQAAPGATPLVIPNPVQLSTAFSQIAKQLEPSVVNISTTYEPKAATSRPRTNRRRAAPNDEEEGGDDSSMQEFFKKFFGSPGSPFGGAPDAQGHKSQALGSGVIVDPNGYILTNNHVVEKADRIQVTLAGTTTKYDAKLIGSDLDTDLAVIRIDAHKPLVAAKIGNSDSVQVGDWAVAIGSPFGLQATVTAGIISAKERDLGGSDHQFQKFLQTDAAINRGNSGGPLLAINGDLIGINTAILSESGGSQGVGFALPINTAAKVYNQIIKNGKVTRGAIGVQFFEAKPELLAVYGAKEGVFVQDVTPDMPAAKAGIHKEDIIVEINGKSVKDGQDLVNRISDMPVGTQVKITALRDKKRQDFMVAVGDRKEIVNSSLGAERPSESAPGKAEATPSKLGISIENLTPARKKAMGFPETEKGGVLVVEVIPGSFAEDLGLETREDVSLVIASINRQPVMSAEDVTRIWTSLKPGEPVVFHIMQAATGAAARSQTGSVPTKWVSTYLAGTVPNTQ